MAKPDDDLYTRKEMRQWLEREVRDVMKAAELRIKDATDFVTAFAVSEISAKEAAERMARYDDRWRESILGVTIEEGMTNQEILRLRDEAAAAPPKDWAKSFREKKETDRANDKSRQS
jgi:hypothetical protein